VALNLDTAWERSEGSSHAIDPEDVTLTLDVLIPVPALDAWDWLFAPDKRTLWEDVDTISSAPRPDRRAGAGNRYHSQQGRHVDEVYEVVDWQPFRRFTWDRHRRGVTVRSTIELEPADGGTRVIGRFGAPPGTGLVQRIIVRREIKLRIAERRAAALARLRGILEVEQLRGGEAPTLVSSDAGRD
jgi:uncharacterized protein YndB with AHSA1/START domain